MKGNKWLNAALPALLIHCSIGTVYCWSTFKDNIAVTTGNSPFAVGWAFSLAIFFLGMSAAFCGCFIEKDIHSSSLISAICFGTGLVGTGLSIQFLKGVPALIGIYIFYGCIMGIGLGIGYLTPVKTLMLWFKDNKGFATGISIMGFGLAKMIATPVMEFLQNTVSIYGMFYILAVFYFITMFIGHILLRKPQGWVEPNVKFKVDLSPFKDKYFVLMWLIFFLNIHCGLMLISYEKQFVGYIFVGATILTTLYTIVPSLSAFFNAAGRLGYSTVSDRLKNRINIYLIISIISIAACALSGLFGLLPILLIVVLCLINANYGGGVSTLPTVLSDKYGMGNISAIHGLALSAWAIAGITGNNTSAIILNLTNNNYMTIIACAMVLYAVQLFLIIRIKKMK